MSPANDVNPFRIAIDQEELDDLRDRLRRTRWPDAEPAGTGWQRGLPRDYLEQLAAYWADGFDWRAQEGAINAVPQFTTAIDGQRIHFLHARAKAPDATPLLLLHSWPGSPVEFARVIGPLTDPAAHGGEVGDAFDVVVPSILGFGFSVPVDEPGWTSGRIARAFAQLMRRLGYERYAVAGGDIGAGIAASLGSVDPEGVVAIHVTTDPPTAVTFASWQGDPTLNANLSPDDQARVRELMQWSTDDEGYLRLQATRPQTIGYALTDSPVAQLAWIVEKFQAWTDAAAQRPEEAVDRDQLLTNVSLYWFTRSGASAAHSLYESMHAAEWSDPGPAPMGFAVFGAEPFVRTLTDPERKVEAWSEFERGGHFPAMEQPDLLVEDLRAFLRRYR
ncbi:MAG: epoxide hydrolase family protein [Candidatus Limnocylindria bacterium]